MNDNPRTPKNLQSLLKFCINADDGASLQTKPMDPEEAAQKGEWLKTVMAENFVNIGAKTKENMIILYKVIETNETTEESIMALEDLQDITEHIEYAKDFIKMGGLDLIRKLLELDFEDILIEASQLLGNTTQNDEFLQLAAINAEFVEFLVMKIDKCENGRIVKNLVYALSCCVRGSSEGLKRFNSVNGTKVLLESMSKGSGEAAPKCAFMLSCLVKESDDIESVFSEMEFKDLITKILSFPIITDAAMEFLVGIVAFALKQQSTYKLVIDSGFISWVTIKLSETKDQAEHEELVIHLTYILEQLVQK